MDASASPRAAPVPFLVSWNVTRRCNLACSHCYLDAVRRKNRTRGELSTGEALDVVRQIAELAPGAMLVFTGGEPLMRGDLPRLIEAAASRGLAPVVGTNGTLLAPVRAQQLKDAGARGVGISLDSASSGFHDRLRGVPGAWARAMRGAAAARRVGIALLLQSTLFQANRAELPALADTAQTLGAVAFNVFFLVCTGRGVTHTDLSPAAYEEALAWIVAAQRERPALKIRARCAPYLRRVLGLHAGASGGGYADWSSACLAGRRYFRITPLGGVTPCPYVPDLAGDLRSQPLQEIWNGSLVLQRLRAELARGKCGDCDYRYGCGGCRARALAVHGDLMAEDPQCSYVRLPGREPEPAPTTQARAGLEWDPEAETRLQRVPAFVREHARARLEEYAQREGVQRITAAFMAAHRPPFLATGGSAAGKPCLRGDRG